jgi:hypothetical protein
MVAFDPAEKSRSIFGLRVPAICGYPDSENVVLARDGLVIPPVVSDILPPRDRQLSRNGSHRRNKYLEDP